MSDGACGVGGGLQEDGAQSHPRPVQDEWRLGELQRADMHRCVMLTPAGAYMARHAPLTAASAALQQPQPVCTALALGTSAA